MRKYIHLIFLITFISYAQEPAIQEEDRVMISEAFRISGLYGNELWDGWDMAPFALILVYDDYEFLINHPSPSDDFKLIGFDSILNSQVYYRNRQFSTQFLATFPAVGGVQTIVVGTSENTGKSSAEWILTILHEHFHQFQYSQPDYYSSINALDLSGGDETGMWMLNYPFPYENQNVNAVYDSCKKILACIFVNNKEPDMNLYLSYLKNRDQLKNILSEEDYKYISFQLWQEGIARYTEIKLLQMMLVDGYEFSDEVKKLRDYKSLKDHYEDYYTNEINLLNGLSLRDSKRNCFYEFGAFEGLLVDLVNPGWRKEYLTRKFFIENYYTD
ncbi:MAG: hypothetical protein EHM47_05225, partial [Ignavibacteriales bacterium]